MTIEMWRVGDVAGLKRNQWKSRGKSGAVGSCTEDESERGEEHNQIKLTLRWMQVLRHQQTPRIKEVVSITEPKETKGRQAVPV